MLKMKIFIFKYFNYTKDDFSTAYMLRHNLFYFVTIITFFLPTVITGEVRIELCTLPPNKQNYRKNGIMRQLSFSMFELSKIVQLISNTKFTEK